MFFSKLLKKFRRFDSESVRDTIEELIEETEEEPSIHKDERFIIGNVLNLRDLCAQDIMIPRASIIASSSSASLDIHIQLMVKHHLSILPIYLHTLDHIVGTLDIRDVLSVMEPMRQHQRQVSDLKKIIKEPLFISPTMRLLDLLLNMRQTGIRLSFVIDEYGGTHGLVTLGAIVESIIGDIEEEYATQIKYIETKAPGVWEADGKTPLEDIEEHLDIKSPLNDSDEDIDTVGGLLVYLAGRVPVRGEVIRHKNLSFEILQADQRRIYRILISQQAQVAKSLALA